MANWRRERDGTGVHVVVEASLFALCGVERETLGATIWETGAAAKDLCVNCSRELLAATSEVVRLTQRVVSETELETAKESLRHLQRLIPNDVTRDLVVYARACIVRGDRKGAHESVVRWRTNMQALGVFGQDD